MPRNDMPRHDDPTQPDEAHGSNAPQPIRALRDWLDHLAKQGRLAVLPPDIALKFDLAAYAKRLDGQRATLFPQPGGHAIPVVSGLVSDRGWMAEAMGVEPDEMLARLPLERVVEVHLSGPRPLAGNAERLDDVHDVVSEREVQLLRRVLEEAQPKAVVLEYRRDAELLHEQLAMLGGVIGRRWRGRPC
jgi:UbiD family decarboxylase